MDSEGYDTSHSSARNSLRASLKKQEAEKLKIIQKSLLSSSRSLSSLVEKVENKLCAVELGKSQNDI